MFTLNIDWAPGAAFTYLILFSRIAAMLMLMPALGEDTIPARLRLSFALLLTLVLYPLLRDVIPPASTDFGPMLGLLFHEIAVGLIIGAIVRITTMATQVAGAIVAFQTGLSGAMAADPTQQGMQAAVFSSFLSFLGITLIFATDLHHMILAAIYDSYDVFSPTMPIMSEDAMQLALKTVAGAFSVGVQMSAPFIVFGLVFNLGAGILARLMPALQVYFLLMPANILAGLVLFALLLMMMMGWYLSAFENHLAMWRG
ncbi:flagellar type III secretion system protein FliR [Devosia sp. BK]|uniref:flagellar biosynthetic protein FliR n=1 Tax=unclassified Devosia TaxID=196773 RepID=UPI000714356F|nr:MULTISPECIES: flagellar biosynthetic protein FliR [unclassified Devosia]KQT44850.1 flagellar biosynthetic protein FliR [Devosia sp. Leaf420]MDV3250488.1 flagellar type III secretion system protein FliR [Devosia sp. BK]